VTSSAASEALDSIIVSTDRDLRAKIAATLAAYLPPVHELCANMNVHVHPLRAGQTYIHASPALRRLQIDVDAWPIPAAGLFVVEERTAYVRVLSPMVIAHEYAHAIDCALGGGVYLSTYDPAIRRAFSAAREFVTPYGACSLDEYWAESARAAVSHRADVNDSGFPWPRATRGRLQGIDPVMLRIVDGHLRQPDGLAAVPTP
jgi:hypothetical protein